MVALDLVGAIFVVDGLDELGGDGEGCDGVEVGFGVEEAAAFVGVEILGWDVWPNVGGADFDAG